MIKNKKEYKAYLKADRKALLGHEKLTWGFRLKNWLAPDYIYKFQCKLRKIEYFTNCKHDPLSKIYLLLLRWNFRSYSLKMGFSIPPNVFGPGLAIVHYGTIIINPKARVGKNCRIHAMVNIGASGGSEEAPKLGDNVYIGPGVKLFGDIQIGNNIAISANSVVNKSFLDDGFMLAGVPAREIKKINISNIIKHIS